MQYLSQPRYYNFDREDIGRIVLFKSEQDSALYPYMIIFNVNQRDGFDDDILFKDVIAESKGEVVILTIHELIGVLNLDYVEILNEPVEKPAGQLFSRRDDMGQGVLQVLLQEDGDVCIGLHNDSSSARDFKNLSVEFCTIGSGGGRSPNTLKALQDLVLAVAKDIDENPL